MRLRLAYMWFLGAVCTYSTITAIEIYTEMSAAGPRPVQREAWEDDYADEDTGIHSTGSAAVTIVVDGAALCTITMRQYKARARLLCEEPTP